MLSSQPPRCSEHFLLKFPGLALREAGVAGGRMASSGLLTLALVLGLGSVACGTDVVSSSELELEIDADSLRFGRVLTGESASKSFTVKNTSVQSAKLAVSISEPFSMGVSNVEVPAGKSTKVEVFFRPSQPGLAEGKLELKERSISFKLDLSGSGVNALDCQQTNPCRPKEFNVESGRCEERVLHGVPCKNACLVDPRCEEGECIGEPVDCGQQGQCLKNTCDPLSGCVTIDSTHALCPSPSDPCRAASCGDDGNCSTSLVPDGVACGPATCSAQFVCSSGACVEKAVKGDCPQQPLCNEGGWCWENPLPQGLDLNAVSQHEDQTWAVGAGGLALRLEDGVWSLVPTPNSQALNAVHASEFGVWIAGAQGTLLELRSDSLRQVQGPRIGAGRTYTSVWAADEDDLFLAANGLVWRRRDGEWSEDWQRKDLQNPRIVADGKGQLWMVSRGNQNGALYRRDNREWVLEWRESRSFIHDVLPAAEGVVVTGMHFDGLQNRQFVFATDGISLEELPAPPLPAPSVLFLAGNYDLEAESGNRLWSSGRFGTIRRLGSEVWVENDSGQKQQLVAAHLSDGAGVAVGQSGALVRYADSKWSSWSFRADSHPQKLSSLWVDASDQAWAVGSGAQILHSKGPRWTRVVAHSSSDLLAVHGRGQGSEAEVWAVGKRGTVLRLEPNGPFRALPFEEAEDRSLLDVFVPAANRAWVAGESGLLYRWNGSAWRSLDSSLKGDLHAITGKGSNEIWVGGDNGLWFWDGNSLEPVEPPRQQASVRSLSLADSEMYALTQDQSGKRRVHRYQDEIWALLPDKLGQDELPRIEEIYSDRDDSLWALSDSGVFHWNGRAWSRQKAPPGLRGIAARSDDVLAVGQQGFVLSHKKIAATPGGSDPGDGGDGDAGDPGDGGDGDGGDPGDGGDGGDAGDDGDDDGEGGTD